MKNNREKIVLGGVEVWLDRSGYPSIWLYFTETATNGIPVDVLYDGKMVASSALNDVEKVELLNYLNKGNGSGN